MLLSALPGPRRLWVAHSTGTLALFSFFLLLPYWLYHKMILGCQRGLSDLATLSKQRISSFSATSYTHLLNYIAKVMDIPDHNALPKLVFLPGGTLSRLFIQQVSMWSLDQSSTLISPVKACLVDIQAWAAAKGHVWVYGPTIGRICVDVCGLCCHHRPHG